MLGVRFPFGDMGVLVELRTATPLGKAASKQCVQLSPNNDSDGESKSSIIAGYDTVAGAVWHFASTGAYLFAAQHQVPYTPYIQGTRNSSHAQREKFFSIIIRHFDKIH
jgi:hypothetical protein